MFFKTRLVPFIILLMVTLGCSQNITASYIKVKQKHEDPTHHSYSIEVIDPFDKEEKEFTIKIKNENTWNLIEEGETYFGSYKHGDLSNGATLSQIKQVSDPEQNVSN
ncbi:hypothetical protein [Sediminibacillus halophilus]|uniref:Uncharacterized protein n=1 Tax=Sediminibacillus halophilus TaxID=482461 RepID=A0A1G9VHL6_9BACI|nr:hypothetical protein [Sediminibacillus halophilus]SDM71639.1 hypothetical protein SAMN05216244_3288 [Sediminibacillus halophilus]